MDWVRTINYGAFPEGQRVSQRLLGRESGGLTCRVECINLPPGGGSPAGKHTHVFEKWYFCLSGTMDIEIENEHMKVGPGSLVLVPKRVPHRNWNSGTEAVVHLAVMLPEPAPGEPVSQPA